MNCPEALSTRLSRTLYDGQGFGTFNIVRRCLGLSWISVNLKRKKVRISSFASEVWPRKICRVMLDKGSMVNSSRIHGSGRLVTMKQIRSHPPTEGRWNTLPKSRRTLDCTSSPSHSSSPSIIITIGCFDSSETCCNGSRISFCNCISSAFVGIDGLLATTASMIYRHQGWRARARKQSWGIEIRPCFVHWQGHIARRKSFLRAIVQLHIVCRVIGRLPFCLNPLDH